MTRSWSEPDSATDRSILDSRMETALFVAPLCRWTREVRPKVPRQEERYGASRPVPNANTGRLDERKGASPPKHDTHPCNHRANTGRLAPCRQQAYRKGASPPVPNA